MGSLETIGVISGGSLTNAAKIKFRDDVVTNIVHGIELGTISLKPNALTLGDFQNITDINEHKSRFPAWHVYYTDGLVKSIASALDSIPDSAVLMPVGIFDPTKPIALLLAKLEDLFSNFGIDEAFLITNLPNILKYADPIGKGLQSIIDEEADAVENFYETLNKALSGKLSDASEDEIEEIKKSIESVAEDIKESMKVKIPNLPTPGLDITSFGNIDISPLFATIEKDGIDGIGTKFIKLMLAFLKIPGLIIEPISKLEETAKTFLDALSLLLTNIEEGVKALLSALLTVVLDIIKTVISFASEALLEISSIISTIKFFVKCFIVAMIGFLMGSGLIVDSIAKLLELV